MKEERWVTDQTANRRQTTGRALAALPDYFRKTHNHNPQDGRNCAFQLGLETPLHFFEYLTGDVAHKFHHHMASYRQGRPHWMDVGFYPVPSLVAGVTIGDDDTLLVDIGGGLGQDLQAFRHRWPDLPGRLVLQDRPEVIERATQMKLDPSIILMSHDFFTDQKVQGKLVVQSPVGKKQKMKIMKMKPKLIKNLSGARVYYLHSVLHDWPDDQCRKILLQNVAAMKPKHSKLLVHENVIPDTNAHWEKTSLDVVMMANFGSRERTERQWRQLLESASLQVKKIWTVRRDAESLIECEVPEHGDDCRRVLASR